MRKIIGLTGGIASGKSTAAAYLASKGYDIIDADLVAREIVAPGTPALTEIAARFGQSVLLADGTLDRRRLGAIVFDDAAALADLNAITHPRIVAAIQEKLAQNKAAVVFLMVPLMYESGLDRLCDVVWAVTAAATERHERLMQRDALHQEAAAQRLRAQMTDAERLAQGARVIANDHDLATLYATIDDCLKEEGLE